MKLCLIVLLAGLLALTNACKSAAPPETPTQGPAAVLNNSQEQTAAINAAQANPANGLVTSFEKALAARSFRAQLEATAEGRVSQVTYEFVAPDRFRMRNGPTEMLLVGEAAYLKTLGSWQKVATGIEAQVKAIHDPQIVEKVKQATNVKFVQPDTLNGQPMLVYEYTSTNLLGVEGNTFSRTWVGMFDGLPYKSEFEGMIGSVKTKGLMIWSDYNTDIKIEPPFNP